MMLPLGTLGVSFSMLVAKLGETENKWVLWPCGKTERQTGGR